MTDHDVSALQGTPLIDAHNNEQHGHQGDRHNHIDLMAALAERDLDAVLEVCSGELVRGISEMAVAAYLFDDEDVLTLRHVTDVAADDLPPTIRPQLARRGGTIGTHEIVAVANITLPTAVTSNGVVLVVRSQQASVANVGWSAGPDFADRLSVAANIISLAAELCCDEEPEPTDEPEPGPVGGLVGVADLLWILNERLDHSERVPGPGPGTKPGPGPGTEPGSVPGSGGPAVIRLDVSAGPFAADEVVADDLDRVASLIAGALEPTDLVAHLGDGDFAVVTATDKANARRMAAGLCELIAGVGEGLDHATGQHVAIAGVATPTADSTATSLLRDALADRHRAARAVDRRKAIEVFDTDEEIDGPTTAEMLIGALNRGEIRPWYQPQFSMETGAIVGAEALARWSTPEGLLAPAAFLGALHRHRLMPMLTAAMVNSVVADTRQLASAGLVDDHYRVAVNITADDLESGRLLDTIAAALGRHRLRGQHLCIEFPQAAVATNRDRAVSVMNGLHQLDVTIVIDDYGSTDTSIAGLSQMPIDVVKLEQRIVAGLAAARRDAAAVEALVGEASAAGFDVAAQGVEADEQMDALRALGVETVQGFLLGHPISLPELKTRLQAD